MVRDGWLYGLGFILAAGLLAWITSPWWAIVPLLLAAFFLWFFRDPERLIPQGADLVVSPADGLVTSIINSEASNPKTVRISIFLSVFDVHVNRAPIGGSVTSVVYSKGQFLNALNPESAEKNERNVVTIESESGMTVVYKQIAGLLARRIVCTERVGEEVVRGQRVGMIKFGSRVDVILPAGTDVRVRVKQRVKGGASILAALPKSPSQRGFASQQQSAAVMVPTP